MKSEVVKEVEEKYNTVVSFGVMCMYHKYSYFADKFGITLEEYIEKYVTRGGEMDEIIGFVLKYRDEVEKNGDC